MKTSLPELLDAELGLVKTHPDDDIPHAHALQAHQRKARALTYTRGKKTTLNYRKDDPEPFDPANGDRASEADAAAPWLGIGEDEMLDYPDGTVGAHHAELIEITADWIVKHGLETILTLGGLHDHRDHGASGWITRLAAGQAALRTGRQIHVLELQDQPPPEARILWAEATPAGMERAVRAASEHGSQFQLVQGIHEDWPLVAGGYSMSPATYADLNRYPLFHDAAYIHYFTSPLPA